VVLEAVEHGIDQGFALEELVPLIKREVRGNQGGCAPVALIQELEEGIDLLRSNAQVAKLVNLNGVVEPVSHRESEAAGARIV